MRMSSRIGVSEGHVACPLRHTQVDVEQCLSCRSFRGIRSANLKAGRIVCVNEVDDALPKPSVLLYGPVYRTSAWRSR